MEQLIQQNIHDFYDAIGQKMQSGFHKSPSISWLNCGSGNWPNMIYNPHFQNDTIENFVAENIAEIKAKKAPPFWLVYLDNDGLELAQQLKKQGLREIFHWTGMGLKVTSPLENGIDKSFTIRKVTTKKELNEWLMVVNTALMTSNTIQPSVFSNLYQQPHFELYSVYQNNKVVTTGLSFFNKNYCGIYMIATLNEYRKKGLGTAITKHCINAAFKKGITNVVLQASPKGESIYHKMGFKNYCEFSIYWMLGKEFK